MTGSVVVRWGRFETRLTARQEHEEPVAGVHVEVEFTHESGEVHRRDAFWDGGRDWIARFSPDLAGRWRWRSRCQQDEGLDGAGGEFECATADGTNPLYRHGPIRIAADGRHFEHADGTPLFWLGDTAWNGPLKSSPEGWSVYLEDRAGKGFNVIQFVATQWVAAAGDANGRRAYNGTNPIHVDPVFFRRLDARVDAINQAGLIAAPVLAWAATWNPHALDLNPGTSLPEDQVAALAAYILARYGAHHTVWILAGDGDYRGSDSARWKRIGRRVIDGRRQLATMHPGGLIWIADEFEDEGWYGFAGYQSGHWRTESEDWISGGEPSAAWKRGRPRPQVNLEFCYEAHEDFAAHRAFDAYDIRRAAWKSILAAPPAGLTYGCHGVWNWDHEPVRPMNHAGTGIAPPWQEAINLPGSRCMGQLKSILGALEWWRLRPCPQLIAEPSRDVSAARSEAGDLALIYLAESRPIHVAAGMLQPRLHPVCIDPASGSRSPVSVSGDRLTPVGPGDRVIVFQPVL